MIRMIFFHTLELPSFLSLLNHNSFGERQVRMVPHSDALIGIRLFVPSPPPPTSNVKGANLAPLTFFLFGQKSYLTRPVTVLPSKSVFVW